MSDSSPKEVHTCGGAAINGNVTTEDKFVGRDNISIVNHGLLILQSASSDFLHATNKSVELGTDEGVTVKLLQHGPRLTTYAFNREESEAEPSPEKKEDKAQHVAVLIDINRRMVHDVATYFDKKGIAVNIVIVTNDPEYSEHIRMLSIHNPTEWLDIIKEFKMTINAIQRYVPGAQLHFFLSTPLALAFGLGSVWGTVRNATVYHFQDNVYYPLLPITRELLTLPAAQSGA